MPLVPGATNTGKFYDINENRISDTSAKKFSIEEDTTILLRFSLGRCQEK